MGELGALTRAHQAGRLLDAIREAILADPRESANLSSDLVALHNGGLIDLIGAFSRLPEAASPGRDFSQLRNVLEDALADLEAPVPETARCVQRLYNEAGGDLGASTILDAFERFCSKGLDRIPAAVAEIEAAPEELADLLPSVLLAGSRGEPPKHAAELTRLASHTSVALRRMAIFAIGPLCHKHLAGSTEDLVALIEQAVETEHDGRLLAFAIRSAVEVLGIDPSQAPRLTSSVAVALSKGGEIALEAASRVFAFRGRVLSEDLLDLLLLHLRHVEIADQGILRNLDYGVHHLLCGQGSIKGVTFLESLLRDNQNELDPSVLETTIRTIRESPILLSRLVTRWLLTGERPLCEGVKAIVDSQVRKPLEVDADPTELEGVESIRLLFVARKAVGYLFLRPITTTSLLLSLLRLVPSESSLREQLGALLFDPLLINFSGTVADYLTNRSKSEVEPVRSVIVEALEKLERYLDRLKAMGEIPALYPSLEHRELSRRFFASEAAKALRNAQAQSVLLQFIPKTVLLYGRKAVYHMFGPEGELARSETQLVSHSAMVEVPRLSILDPQGLDLILHVFSHERLPA